MLDPMIHFKDMDRSEAVEADILKRIDRLQKTFSRLTSCRVTVEGNHGAHHGIPYRVVVDVTLPGAELVVGRSPSARAEHVDVYVAVRDAFQTARRELLELRQRMRGEVKTHAA
jgi:ribosome-associated translation inhibitor RaiA